MNDAETKGVKLFIRCVTVRGGCEIYHTPGFCGARKQPSVEASAAYRLMRLKAAHEGMMNADEEDYTNSFANV